MTLADVVLAIIWIGISAYALFGGADFGAGVWDLIAGGPDRGGPARALIERSIGPVWEANHVWLIFVLVFLWTGFPEPFAAIASTMVVPLTLAAIGIIFRGAGFAFRKWVDRVSTRRTYGAAFAGASVLTPFFLGTVVGGVASGRVPLGNAEGDLIGAWLNPTSILGGVLAVLACAFVAASLLCREAGDDADMAEYFRLRALASGGIAGLVAAIGIIVLAIDAPQLFDGLVSPRGIPVMAASAIGGSGALSLLWHRQYGRARVAAALATVAVLWGWAAGQYPYLLEPDVTVDEFAASPPVLTALIVTFVIAGVVAIPPLLWMYVLTERGILDSHGDPLPGSSEELIMRLSSKT